jgi:Fe2+ transport system protein FeoA
MSVFDLSVGEEGEIVKINVSGKGGERLSSLGFAVGKSVQVLGFSLFKSSVLLAVGQTRVAVRKEVAKLIEVAK